MKKLFVTLGIATVLTVARGQAALLLTTNSFTNLCLTNYYGANASVWTNVWTGTNWTNGCWSNATAYSWFTVSNGVLISACTNGVVHSTAVP